VPTAKPPVQIDVEALARALVPLLVPPLLEALAGVRTPPTKGRAIRPAPPPPPRRLWTPKEAAEWATAAPNYRIVWDEQGTIMSLDNLGDKLTPGQRVWQIIGWDESRTNAWLQLAHPEWSDDHVLFHLFRSEDRQPDPDADPDFFEHWQTWCVMNPSSESGPIYPWKRRRRKRQSPRSS
jgi:hypothetical protein